MDRWWQLPWCWFIQRSDFALKFFSSEQRSAVFFSLKRFIIEQ
jgi:hypothetical protein